MKALVLTPESSSLKFQVIRSVPDQTTRNNDERLCRELIDRIGGEAIITLQTRKSPRQNFNASLSDKPASLDYPVHWTISDPSGMAEARAVTDMHAVGHRVIHGGELFADSAFITDEVSKGIEDCVDLAPLHNPTTSREFSWRGKYPVLTQPRLRLRRFGMGWLEVGWQQE